MLPPPRWPEPGQDPHSQRELINRCGQALKAAGLCVPGQLTSPLCASASWRGGAHTAPPINVWMRRVGAEPMLSKAAAARSRKEVL